METTMNNTMKQVIVVTGASSGFGALAARALADSGHTVYAGMRETGGRNAAAVKAVKEYATERNVDLRPIELDVASQESADSAIEKIVAQSGRLDVVVHNAGHIVFGPAEAFTPEQFAELYDINVLSTQRVNRSALPQLRKQGRGLLVWVSSSSVAGGTPPYLAPYFAAKAAMDALAVQYARELTLWGIETSIIVPGDGAHETHSAWTLELTGVSGATLTLRWCALRKWNGSRVVHERHYEHHQSGEALTFGDLNFNIVKPQEESSE
jgi:NAD(P)-dependent dehydrogenase (short-subunit alcohol dehydrogenase family)